MYSSLLTHVHQVKTLDHRPPMTQADYDKYVNISSASRPKGSAELTALVSLRRSGGLSRRVYIRR